MFAGGTFGVFGRVSEVVGCRSDVDVRRVQLQNGSCGDQFVCRSHSSCYNLFKSGRQRGSLADHRNAKCVLIRQGTCVCVR